MLMVDLKFEVYTSHQTGLHDVVFFSFFIYFYFLILFFLSYLSMSLKHNVSWGPESCYERGLSFRTLQRAK